MPCYSDLQNGNDRLGPQHSPKTNHEILPRKPEDEKLPLIFSKTNPNGFHAKRNSNSILSRSSSVDCEKKVEINTKTGRRLLNWKDIVVLSLACFSHNFGYFGILFNLSSLHADDADLAFNTLTSVSAVQVIGSLFLATFFIQRLGCKVVLIFATGSNIFLSLAQFYPGYSTFVPAGIILGVGNLCTLVVLGTYVSMISLSEVKITGKRLDTTLGWYYGFVNMFRYGGGLASNYVCYFLLSNTNANSTVTPNNSTNQTVDNSTICGFYYCNEPLADSEINMAIEGNNERILYIIFIIVACCGPVISLFLGSRVNENAKPIKINILKQCKYTIMVLLDIKMLLLTITFLNAGLLRGFITGDYANGYILCSLDLSIVSLSATVLNITYVALAMFGGLLNSLFGIRWSMVLNASVPVAVYAYLIAMKLPDDNTFTIFLFISATVGAVLGIYNTLSSTILSLMCEDKEIAFSIYRMSFEMGSAFGYFWSNHLCMTIKLPILLSMNVIGIITYIWSVSKMPNYEQIRSSSEEN